MVSCADNIRHYNCRIHARGSAVGSVTRYKMDTISNRPNAAHPPRFPPSLDWTSLGPATGLILLAFITPPLSAEVRFNAGTDQIAVQINGQPFTVVHFGKQERKPFLHPLLTPSGKNVLRV